MSAIGRTFLVLNLILSALFLGWAIQLLSQGDQWREKYEVSQAQLVSAEAAHTDAESGMQSQLEVEQTRSATLKNDSDSFEQRAVDLSNELASERARFGALQSDMTVMTQNMGDLTSQLGSLESAKDAAVGSARSAERDRDDAIAARIDADKMSMDLRDQLDRAQLNTADLEMALTTSEKRASRLDSQLATVVDEYGIEIGKILEQPLVQGAVLSVKNMGGIHLIALNVGSQDAVVRGMTFQIWSGSRYKGEVRVDNVTANMCTALVTMLADSSVPMTEGDNAATRL